MKFLITLFFFMLTPMAFADSNNNNKKDEGTNNNNQPRRIVISRESFRKREDDNTNPPPRDNKQSEGGADSNSGEGEGLRDKVTKETQQRESRNKEAKQIERALDFTLSVDRFVKENSDLLPKEVSDIVRLANQETYDTAIDKAAAMKSAIIQSYFSQQGNVDALTRAQKENLEDYLKLTKKGKEDRAAFIYETIFEPCLETNRKVKKAEEVGRSRSGFATTSDAANAYRDKLMKGSRRLYLGEREA